MKILALGDVFGQAAVELMRKRLGALRKQTGCDLVIANGENAADGRGITPQLAQEMFWAGVDVLTLGNHAYANRSICTMLDEHDALVRPYNLSSARPGQGYCLIDVAGKRVCVAALLGRVHMDFHQSDPFAAADRLLAQVEADHYIIDFHAQATSEKRALGYHLDGRVSVLFGTHTHVQTSDAMVLPRGTGYLTDLGLCGAQQSVIGVLAAQSVSFFRGEMTERFVPSTEQVRLQGALFTLDERGQCTNAEIITFS